MESGFCFKKIAGLLIDYQFLGDGLISGRNFYQINACRKAIGFYLNGFVGPKIPLEQIP